MLRFGKKSLVCLLTGDESDTSDDDIQPVDELNGDDSCVVEMTNGDTKGTFFIVSQVELIII